MTSPKNILWIGITAFVLGGCAVTPTPAVLAPSSGPAVDIANLFNTLNWMGLGVFLLVIGLLTTIVIRNRYKRGDTHEPEQVYGSNILEWIWTLGPVLLVILIFIMTVRTMNATATPQAGPDDIKVNVIGHRWWWEFQYPDLGITTANDLVIPVGANVILDVTSADVIHSFWAPQLNGKIDVVPGQVNTTWIRADEAGRFDGYCAEFCGEQHTHMRFAVIAQPRAEFDAWVTAQTQVPAQPTTGLEAEGFELVAQGACAGCHVIDGTNARGEVGPNLTHLYSRTLIAGGVLDLNDENLITWLRNPGEVKPHNLMAGIRVSDQQMQAVIAYLKTLK